MKKLKFDHDTVQLILAGKRNVTWRMYDDQDISVNDELEFIDKEDVADPSTWRIFASARVNVVVEKRLADIRSGDIDNGGQSLTRRELLKKYQQYYGPQVTPDTPVKMIQFTLLPKKVGKVSTDVQNTTYTAEAKLYADGGSRGNPGPSASGYAILDMEGHILVKDGVYLGVTTNNQAEYQSLKFGLEAAIRLHIRTIHVYMDSMLVINQMLGVFKVKNRDLWPIHDALKALTAKFEHITFMHVPRELNKLADAAVNEALDIAAKHNK